MSRTVLQPQRLPSLLAMIRGAVGTNLFRAFYCRTSKNKTMDVLNDGALSCAVVVSSILVLHGLLPRPRATVERVLEDLAANGWKRIRTPKTGCVLHWGPGPESDGHAHIGFYIGNRKAVSNSTARRVPVIHHWTYGTRGKHPARPVLGMWWHPDLDSDRA